MQPADALICSSLPWWSIVGVLWSCDIQVLQHKAAMGNLVLCVLYDNGYYQVFELMPK